MDLALANLHQTMTRLQQRLDTGKLDPPRAHVGDRNATTPHRCRLRSSSSSSVFGQLSLSRRLRLRSASSLPPVWQVGQ